MSADVRFPTVEEIKKDYEALMDIVQDVRTIEGAKRAQVLLKDVVEINGMTIDEFENGMPLSGGRRSAIQGTDEDIEWVRYENYGCLGYVYVRMDGSEPRFDVFPDGSDSAFLDNVRMSDITEGTWLRAVQAHCSLTGIDFDSLGLGRVDDIVGMAVREVAQQKIKAVSGYDAYGFGFGID